MKALRLCFYVGTRVILIILCLGKYLFLLDSKHWESEQWIILISFVLVKKKTKECIREKETCLYKLLQRNSDFRKAAIEFSLLFLLITTFENVYFQINKCMTVFDVSHEWISEFCCGFCKLTPGPSSHELKRFCLQEALPPVGSGWGDGREPPAATERKSNQAASLSLLRPCVTPLHA